MKKKTKEIFFDDTQKKIKEIEYNEEEKIIKESEYNGISFRNPILIKLITYDYKKNEKVEQLYKNVRAGRGITDIAQGVPVRTPIVGGRKKILKKIHEIQYDDIGNIIKDVKYYV